MCVSTCVHSHAELKRFCRDVLLTAGQNRETGEGDGTGGREKRKVSDRNTAETDGLERSD